MAAGETRNRIHIEPVPLAGNGSYGDRSIARLLREPSGEGRTLVRR